METLKRKAFSMLANVWETIIALTLLFGVLAYDSNPKKAIMIIAISFILGGVSFISYTFGYRRY